MNKKNLTNLFIVILAIASVMIAILNQGNNFAIVFALALSLLGQTKDDDYNQIYFSIALFSSILLFGLFPIASLMIFEVARLFKKGFRGLRLQLFSLVPVVTLMVTATEYWGTTFDNQLYYLSFSFLLILSDGARSKNNWPSLVMILFFLTKSELGQLSHLLPSLIVVYLLYTSFSVAITKKGRMFPSVCLSTLGLVALSFSLEKVLALVIVTIVFEQMLKLKRISTALAQIIYIFTLFYFSSIYIRDFIALEDLYPALFYILPIFLIKKGDGEVIVRKKLGQEDRNIVFTFLSYLMGVLIYAY